MNITRFEPWGLLDAMQRDFDRFGRPRTGMIGRGTGGEVVTDWGPGVDGVGGKKRLVLRADGPLSLLNI